MHHMTVNIYTLCMYVCVYIYIYKQLPLSGMKIFRNTCPLTLSDKNCEFWGTDNVQGQLHEYVFVQNRGYCVYYPSDILQCEWKKCLQTAICLLHKIFVFECSLIWLDKQIHISSSSVTTAKPFLVLNDVFRPISH